MKRDTQLTTAATRCFLTLAFVDLSRSTQISQAMESEHYMELMDELRVIWQEVANQHQGYIVRSQGDGVLIMFGYPDSSEEDGRRAADAALEIQRRVTQLRPSFLPRQYLPLQTHSGMHSGTTIISQGDIERGRFDLSGDVPNTAAKLASFALPGQIVASLSVLGPHANYFDLRPFAGQASGLVPKDLQVITGRHQIHTRFDATKKRGLTPLIGRERVLADIEQFLMQKTSTCLVLEGSAGLGKTRLLNELQHKHSNTGMRFMYGTYDEQTTSVALQAFTQMLKTHVGAGFNDLAISKTLKTSDFIEFFNHLDNKENWIILIDDWQWADDASRHLVNLLLDLRNGPKIVLASRPTEDRAFWIQEVQHLSLAALTESQTALAVRRWIASADPFLCESIYRYSGGIPLFVEELCHSATAVDIKKTLTGTGITQTWLGSLIASRFARQKEYLQEIIRTCAVIGNTVPLWLLEATMERSIRLEEIAELEDVDFLYPIYQEEKIATLIFKHGITWDAVYKGINFKIRANLHTRILNSIAQHNSSLLSPNETVELLAHHSRGACDWASAAHFAELAGDKSFSGHALDLANLQFKSALDALDRIQEPTRDQQLSWCKLSGKLALTSIFDPLSLGNDLSIFEAAIERAIVLKDSCALAQAQYWIGYLKYGLGNFQQARHAVETAIQTAHEAGATFLLAPFEATLGQIFIASCRYDEGLALLKKSLEMRKRRTEKLKGSSAMGAAYSLAIAGFAYADRGQFNEAHSHFDEALDLLADTAHPIGNSVRNFICISYIWQENWEAAERIAVESKKIAENSRALLLLASSSGLLDYIHWATGKDNCGLARFKETLIWMDDHKSSFYTSLYFGFLAHACTQEGQFAEARQYTVRVILRRKEGEILGEAMAYRAMAKIEMGLGRSIQASRWLKRADKSALARKSERESRLNQLLKSQIN